MKTKLSVYQLIYVPTLTCSHELWVLIKRMRLWSKELFHIKRRVVRCFWQLTGTPPGSLLEEMFSAGPAGGDPGSDTGQAGYLGLGTPRCPWGGAGGGVKFVPLFPVRHVCAVYPL